MEFLNTSIIIVAIAFSISFYFLFKSARNRKNLPPEAGGAWPILGHLHIFRGPKLPHVTLGAMADVYGPAFTIRLGLNRMLVVSSWKLAKELFTNPNDVHVSSRPKLRAVKHLGYNNVMFGFSPYGSYWRQLRKLTFLGLLSGRRLEQLQHVRAAEVDTAMKELYEVWSEKKTAGGGSSGRVLVEMKQWFGRITLNVLLRMVVGKRFYGTITKEKNCDVEEERIHRFRKVLTEFFKFLGILVPADALPFLGWFDIGGYEKAMKGVAKEMDSIIDEWLHEHRLKKELVATENQDFMDAMLSQLEGLDLDGYDADTVIKSTCLSLISGGGETVMVMLTWVLSLMMNNLHVLKMAQEELDMVVGKERKVTESDINNLVYLQAIVKETFRLYPAGPLGGSRIFTEDCTISGFHVPKGTWLTINIWKLQRDPQIWSNSLEFKPERFINSHKDVDVLGQDFELTPFGAGRRICPGATLSLQMLHLILASLLHSFELSNVTNGAIDMTESAGLTNLKVTPLEILIAPRLSPCLY